MWRKIQFRGERVGYPLDQMVTGVEDIYDLALRRLSHSRFFDGVCDECQGNSHTDTGRGRTTQRQGCPSGGMNDDAPSADNSFKLLADHILRLEFNWFQPGRRYMKLLTRLALSRA